MMGHDVEHLFAVLHSAARRDLHTQERLLAVVMYAGIEQEFAAALGVLDRPPGEASCCFGDVGLRVSTVDAERVEFEQLTAVVFIQAARTFLLPAPKRLRRV